MARQSVVWGKSVLLSLGVCVMIGTLVPTGVYGQFKPAPKRTIKADEKADIKGVLLKRDGETFVLRDLTPTDTMVVLTDTTKIRTERKGLFRGNKPFDMSALIPGLILKAEGKGDAQGRLVAKDITFSDTDLKAAMTAYAQTAPVGKQAAETSAQLSETDKRLAETSAEVIETDKRISNLDEYDVVKTVTVLFPLNSSTLGAEQKAQLDELAAKAPGAKNYMVEVKGFTDPTGNFDKNLELSQDRADTVVQYLVVKHNIPMRRIMQPMGYGETKPVTAGVAEESNKQSRRVEVVVLVNKGLNK